MKRLFIAALLVVSPAYADVPCSELNKFAELYLPLAQGAPALVAKAQIDGAPEATVSVLRDYMERSQTAFSVLADIYEAHCSGG